MKETKTFDSELTQYEIKKKQYAEVTPLDALLVISNIEEISKKICSSSSHYYMLLCNDRKDYTVFHINNTLEGLLRQEIQVTLQNRGEIIDMYDGCQDNSWEIWIRNNKECFCYILFEYDSGVIEI